MVTRVGGLASGMDIDALVEKLMNAERAPLNKLHQNKQTYEWQREAYRSVNTKLKTFDTYIADNLVLKTLNSKTASSSNESLVKATATGKATAPYGRPFGRSVAQGLLYHPRRLLSSHFSVPDPFWSRNCNLCTKATPEFLHSIIQKFKNTS